MRKYLLLIILVFLAACVGPEEPLDGLYKNSPVVVNTNNAFTFSLRAQNYSTEEKYSLTFNNQAPIKLTTVLIVTEYASKATDTSYFEIFNAGDSLLNRYELKSNIHVAPTEDVTPSAIPKEIFFKADNFTGMVQLVIAVGD